MNNLFKNLFAMGVLVLWVQGAAAQSVTIQPNLISTPRLTYDAIVAIPNPQEGSTVYDITFKCLRVYNGSKWVCLTSESYSYLTPIAQAGGKSFDKAYSIAVGGSGNIYITGSFTGRANFGGLVMTPEGVEDLFVAKYNSRGALQWVQKAGGVGAFTGGANIVVDGNDNVYITGNFDGTVTFGSTTLTSELDEIFVAKYNDNGTLQWVRKAGGKEGDFGSGIAVDGSGNVYVTGSFSNTATFGTTTLTSAGSSDIFVAKYNNSGVLQWVQKAGGVTNDGGYKITVDDIGNVYFMGSFTGTVTFFSTTTLTSTGWGDMFIAKFNRNGSFQWVQKVGEEIRLYEGDLAVDGSSNVYVTGSFTGTSTFGTTTLTSVGYTDIFIAKYNSSGTLQWVQKAGGISYDYGKGIAVDGSGNVYITGGFSYTASFGNTSLTEEGWASARISSMDIFIAKYNTTGSLLWAQQSGGTDGDWGEDVAVDRSGMVVVTGYFFGISMFSTNLTSAGQTDIFIARIDK